METPYIGAIVLWAPTKVIPYGWLACEGQILNIAQYQPLASLLGTTYGGNGTTTFGLPDLRGAVPIGTGTSNVAGRISTTRIGQTGGKISTTLTQAAQLPLHTHTWAGQASNLQTTATSVDYNIPATDSPANTDTPSSTAYLAKAALDGTPAQIYNNTAGSNKTIPGGKVNIPAMNITGTITGTNGSTGSGSPVDITPPYLALRYIIAYLGDYPTNS